MRLSHHLLSVFSITLFVLSIDASRSSRPSLTEREFYLHYNWASAGRYLLEIRKRLFQLDHQVQVGTLDNSLEVRWKNIRNLFGNFLKRNVNYVMKLGTSADLFNEEALKWQFAQVGQLIETGMAPTGEAMAQLLEAMNRLDAMLDLVSGDDDFDTQTGPCLASKLNAEFSTKNSADLRAIVGYKVCVETFVRNLEMAKFQPDQLQLRIGFEGQTRSERRHLQNKFHECHVLMMDTLTDKEWAANVVGLVEELQQKVSPILDGKSAKQVPKLSDEELGELFVAATDFLYSAFGISEKSMPYCLKTNRH